MNRSPYRHSVWTDVLSVMFAGAVLLGGAGCLLYHAGGAVNGSSSSFSQGGGSAFPIQGHRSARPSRSSGGGTARRGGQPASEQPVELGIVGSENLGGGIGRRSSVFEVMAEQRNPEPDGAVGLIGERLAGARWDRVVSCGRLLERVASHVQPDRRQRCSVRRS